MWTLRIKIQGASSGGLRNDFLLCRKGLLELGKRCSTEGFLDLGLSSDLAQRCAALLPTINSGVHLQSSSRGSMMTMRVRRKASRSPPGRICSMERCTSHNSDEQRRILGYKTSGYSLRCAPGVPKHVLCFWLEKTRKPTPGTSEMAGDPSTRAVVQASCGIVRASGVSLPYSYYRGFHDG